MNGTVVTTAPSITFDFSGAEAFLGFARVDDQDVAAAVDRLATCYTPFLNHHRRHLTDEAFRREIMLAKNSSSANVRQLTDWSVLLTRDLQLEQLLADLKANERRFIDWMVATAFNWLPMLYLPSTRVLFLVDTLSSGYQTGYGWVCDLSASLAHPDGDQRSIKAQLLSIICRQELGYYYAEFWNHYLEKLPDAVLLYRLLVSIEAIKQGMPHFLLQHLDLSADGPPPVSQTGHSDADQCRTLADFLRALTQSADPRAYYSTNVGALYQGRYSCFQVAGARTCRHLLDSYGQETLIKVLANPIVFLEHVEQVTRDDRPSAAVIAGGHTRQAEGVGRRPAGETTLAPAGERLTACGAHIVFLPGDGRTRFAILLRTAGAGVDWAYQRGCAHLAEHYLTHLIRHRIAGLTFLKGTTDFHHCVYCGTLDPGSETSLINLLDLLLAPAFIDADFLQRARKAVELEIQAVEYNPFYRLETTLLDFVAGDRHSIRGNRQDLQAVDDATVQRFIESQYDPRHMVIVICGSDSVALGDSVAAFIDAKGTSPVRVPHGHATTTHPREKGRLWQDAGSVITTCSIGFVCTPIPNLHGVGGYLLTSWVENRLSACHAAAGAASRCVMFSGYKNLDRHGLCLIHIQGMPAAVNITLKRFLSEGITCDDMAARETARDMYERRVGMLRELWHDDFNEYCLAAAHEYAGDGPLHSPRLIRPEDGSAWPAEDMVTAPAASISPERMIIAGFGPEQLDPESL